MFYDHPYGFRPKHSTIHPFLHLTKKFAKADNLRPKEMTPTVLHDISKAFDVINHSMLIRKLEFYGIRGIVNDWIINYFTERAKTVQIDSHMSEQSNIKCGVPQGSILGPLLY